MRAALTLLLFTFLMVAQTGFAQSGPGGVGSSANMLIWMNADSSVFNDAGTTAATNGNTVQQWNDQSGNSNNLSQSTAASRATLVTNQLNSHNVLNFDGSNDFYRLELGATAAPFTFIGVFAYDNLIQPNNNFDYVYNLGAGSSGINTNVSISRAAGNFGSGPDDYYSFDGANIRFGPNIVGQAYNVYSQIFATSAPFHNLFLDGSSSTVTDYTASVSTSGAFNLGRFQNGTNGLNFLDGDVAEFVLFDFEINTAQRKIIENYLAAKYGLIVANSSLYSFGSTHPHEVFGIGRDDVSNEQTVAQGSGKVRIESASSLGDSDFMLIGHDNLGLSTTTSDLPVAIASTASRVEREWRVDETNDVGTVTIVFDLEGWSFSNSSSYELLIDADGDFTSGATRHTTGLSFDAIANELTFTNVDLSNSDFFTLAAVAGVINSNVASGNWNSTGSWDCGCIPSGGQQVNILAGHNITVDISNAESGDLDIAATGTLSFNASTNLSVAGDLTNGGSITAGTGKLTFAGNSAQSFTNNSTTVTLNDLALNNANGLTLVNGEYQLGGKLELVSGTLNNTATFTFLSTDTRTSTIIDGTGNISGSYTVQRWVGTRNANWADIASPVTSITIANWDTDIFMSGVGGNDGTACCPAFNSVFKYNNTSQAFNAVTTTATTVTTGEALEIWLASNANTLDIFTFQSKGSIDLSSQALTTNTGNFNLLGNPYPSFLGWTELSATNGSYTDNFFVFDGSTGNYATKGDGDFIAPHQGFWVQSTGGSSFTINTTHIVDNDASAGFPDRLDVAPKYLQLDLTNDANPFSHKTFVGFAAEAMDGRDNNDLSFLPSPQKEAPNITSTLAGQKIYRNVLSAGQEYVSVPLQVEVGEAGNYTLSADEFTAVEDYECILLEDLEANKTIDLRTNHTYTFDMYAEGETRDFRLHFIAPEHPDCEIGTSVTTVTENSMEVRQAGTQAWINFQMMEETAATVQVFNLLGQEIIRQNVKAHTQRFVLDLPTYTATYLVVVRTGEQTFSQKVILTDR